MKISEPQKEGLRKIKDLNEWMRNRLNIPEEHCWFNQASLRGVNYHTLQALKTKGFLEEVYESDRGEYYRFTGKEVE